MFKENDCSLTEDVYTNSCCGTDSKVEVKVRSEGYDSVSDLGIANNLNNMRIDEKQQENIDLNSTEISNEIDKTFQEITPDSHCETNNECDNEDANDVCHIFGDFRREGTNMSERSP